MHVSARISPEKNNPNPYVHNPILEALIRLSNIAVPGPNAFTIEKASTGHEKGFIKVLIT
ncbi:MAG: hypothetical protein KKC46_17545 [Proteobacteria bacterium]|nr:hypothetical protein [Pseudomonadota bacterium]